MTFDRKEIYDIFNIFKKEVFMKKLLSILVFSVMLVLSAFGLLACGETPPPSPDQPPVQHDCATQGHEFYDYVGILNKLNTNDLLSETRLDEIEQNDTEFFEIIQMWQSVSDLQLHQKGTELLKNYHAMTCKYCSKVDYELHNTGAVDEGDIYHSFSCNKCANSVAQQTPHTYNDQNKCSVCAKDMPQVIYTPIKNGEEIVDYNAYITETATGDVTIMDHIDGKTVSNVYFGINGGDCKITSLTAGTRTRLISNEKEGISTGAKLPNLKTITAVTDNPEYVCILRLEGCPVLEEIKMNTGNIISKINSPKLIKVQAKYVNTIWADGFENFRKDIEYVCSNTEELMIFKGVKSILLDDTVKRLTYVFENEGLTNTYTLYAPNLIRIDGHFSMNKISEFNAPIIEQFEMYQFYGCENLDTLYMPSTLKNVATYSIFNCRNLKNIYWDVPATTELENSFYQGDYPGLKFIFGKNTSFDKIKEIKNSLSYYVTEVEFADDFDQTSLPAEVFKEWRFESITLPDSIVTVGDMAFASNTSLRTINCSEELMLNPNVIDGCTSYEFIEDEYATYFINTLISVKPGITALIVKEGTIYVACSNLSSVCPDLERITLADSVRVVKEGAFSDLANLVEVDLANVEIIEENAFNNCDSLVSIELPETLEALGNFVFGGCDSLENIVTNGFEISLNMVTGSKYKGEIHGNGYYIGDIFMAVVDGTKFVRIKDGTTTIYGGAFAGLTQLKYVYIPKSVETYEQGVFSTCTNVILVLEKNGNLSNSGVDSSRMYRNRNVNDQGFEYEGGSSEMEISGYYGDVVGTLEIPATIEGYPVVSVGYTNQTNVGAFENNTVITKVILPSTVTQIEQRAFMNSAITEINLDNVMIISPEAFKGCDNLTTVTCEGVWTIVDEYFQTITSVNSNDANFISYLTNTYAGYAWINYEF